MTTIITIIDALTANIATLALIIVLAKFITKRTNLKKLDAKLMKIHKPATYVLLITGIIHLFTSFVYLDQLGFLPYILGFICLFATIGAVVSYVKRKELGKHWLLWHRVCSVVALVTLVAHPLIISTH